MGRFTILALIFATVLPAFAEKPTIFRSFKVTDASTGVLTVTVLDYGLPVDPYLMTISLLCYDKRTKPNVVSPSEEVIIRNKPLCDFGRYEFDDHDKIVTLRYSTTESHAGPAQCNAHWSQPFYLKQLCAKWQP